MPLAVYRIIAGTEPVGDDFLSNAEKHIRDIRGGRTPRSIPRTGDLLHMWSGVSVYRSEERARAIAQGYPNLGRLIAQLQIPIGAVEDGGMRIEKTAADPEHYTLWGAPNSLRACVQSTNSV